MNFEIMPAIDLRGGQCVRLVRGDYNQETVYGADPVVMARQWESQGATRLHLVDLDGARDGRQINAEVVGEIAKALAIPTQLGGGLRSQAAIQNTLDMGISRCIIGTRAIENESWAREMFAAFGEQLILGIDARDGLVATAGWLETSQVLATDFARQMQDLGCRRIIFTDIARDGTLQGPNLDALKSVAQSVEIPIIASGGVHVSADVRAIRQLNLPNIEGVIVGKALYEQTATMPDLLRYANEEVPSV